MSHVYVDAWALGCFHNHISTQTFQRALTTLVDSCVEIKSAPFSGVTKSGRVWREVPECDAGSVLSPLSATFPGCFFGLFCPVLLGGCFLALRRASISSDWFFVWHSLGLLLPSFLFIIIVVFVLADTWLGYFFF